MHEKNKVEENKVEESKVWPPEPTTSRPPEKQIAAVPAGSILMVVPGLAIGFFLYLLGWIGILVVGVKWNDFIYAMHPGVIGGLAWLLVPNLVPGMMFWHLRRRTTYLAYGTLVGSILAFAPLALYGLVTMYKDAHGG